MTETEKAFAKKWIKELSGGLLKNFPSDFISGVETETILLPQKQLLLGPELFGNYEIIDIDNNLFIHAETYEKAKYILYSNRTKPASISIPKQEQDIKTSVRNFEAHLDNILRGLEKEFTNEFSGSKYFHEISNLIFISLNLIRY